MAKQSGSLWVEGESLHYVDEYGDEWKIVGENTGQQPGGEPGSIWIENDRFYYIDFDYYKRECPKDQIATTSGIAGSAWVEGNYVHFLDSSSNKLSVSDKERNHQDSSLGHTDQGGDDDHTDDHTDHHYHSDSHSDSGFHADSGHSSSGHHNSHDDTYNDVVYWDHEMTHPLDGQTPPDN